MYQISEPLIFCGPLKFCSGSVNFDRTAILPEEVATLVDHRIFIDMIDFLVLNLKVIQFTVNIEIKKTELQ